MKEELLKIAQESLSSDEVKETREALMPKPSPYTFPLPDSHLIEMLKKANESQTGVKLAFTKDGYVKYKPDSESVLEA